ncbi:MAG: nucleoside/nucleotide kinase family protein [Pseudomonadota bacterium]
MTRDAVCARILGAAPDPVRRVIAVVGPPGSGKSTYAAALATDLRAAGTAAVVVPMDGFHLDNRLLERDGTRNRKGAPQTFDVCGLLRLATALQSPGDVIFPLFDRSRDIAIAGAGRVPATCDTVLVEGNYLLFDAPLWRDLRPLWTVSIALTPPRAVLRQRLMQRWLDHGWTPDQAAAWVDDNDMKNTDLVLAHMLPADLTLSET